MIPRDSAHVGRAVTVAGLAVGVLGLAVCIIGFIVDARRAYASYLAAYVTVLTTVLGMLILVMISHVSGAKWFVVLRRLAETVAVTIPVLVLLFIPILCGMHDLYPWVPPLDGLPDAMRTVVRQKAAYLNVPFFVVRAVIYFGVWLVVAGLLRSWSVRQDRSEGTRLTHYQRRLSAGGLPAVAITLTFAAFDWLMSLTPAWYSTIYGVYVFAGGFVAGLALLAVLVASEYERGWLVDPALREHLHALGKLELTFVIFWAYIAFAQILIIWIGGLPAEITWYADRTHGAWAVVSLTLVAGNFALPFLCLLSARLKRRPGAMANVGVWLLLMHWLDVTWLVLPGLHSDGLSLLVWNLAALAATAGLVTAYGSWRLRSSAIVPLGDPYLRISLDYRSTA